MQRFVATLAFVSALSACGPATVLTNSPGGAGDLVCIGDPDRGGVVCKPLSDLWDCDALPNGAQKCSRPGAVTPGGAADWSCTHDGSQVVCTAAGSSGIGGSSDWDCVVAGGVTTCTSTTGADVPGQGSWACTVDKEFGVVCEGSPADSSGSGGASVPGSSGGSGEGGSSPPGAEEGGSTTPGSGEGGGASADAFRCSYAMVVFTYGGATYVVKIPKGWTTCTFTNQTSSDAQFEYQCNGHSYSNPGFVFSRDGVAMTPFDGSLTCEQLLSVSGREVTALPGVTILYAAAHNGSFENHFQSLCPPPGGTDQLSFPDSCS